MVNIIPPIKEMHAIYKVDCNLMISGSNDWTARLADLRCLTSAHSEPDPGEGLGGQ